MNGKATTTDAFLGGRVCVRQPAKGFRSGVDAVLLAAAVPAKTGERVLELGCGAGVALMCLAARVDGLALDGVERQAELAELAQENVKPTGARIWEADLAEMPLDLRQISFDHVFANPPYFSTFSGDTGDNPIRAGSRHETTELSQWAKVAMRRLRTGGSLTFIQRADRTLDMIQCLGQGVGDVCILPIVARDGRDAKLVIVSARKGSKAPFRLLSPLVMHDGPKHMSDSDDYSPSARAILADAAPLLVGR